MTSNLTSNNCKMSNTNVSLKVTTTKTSKKIAFLLTIFSFLRFLNIYIYIYIYIIYTIYKYSNIKTLLMPTALLLMIHFYWIKRIHRVFYPIYKAKLKWSNTKSKEIFSYYVLFLLSFVTGILDLRII